MFNMSLIKDKVIMGVCDGWGLISNKGKELTASGEVVAMA